ncbi:MAG: helical backbone metal receptor [Burkholderiales bacterium]|nr:helical backbone metal receptor [Burkholderiales bacterium]
MTHAPADALTPLRDALGRGHAPAVGPARIVSLVPSLTELLFALDLGDQLVGRTGFCIHPEPAVRAVPKLGGTKDVDLDALRALAPTHVLVNIDENERPMFEALERFVPNIIVTHPVEVEDNLTLYALLGTIFHREAPARSLAAALSAELAACAGRDWPWQRVLYLIWKDPWMTVGEQTYIARMLAQVRLAAVAPDDGRRYPVVDFEHFDASRFEAVLLSSEPYRFQDRHVAQLAAAAPIAGRPVRLVDGEMTSWYGVRAIEGLRYLRAWRDRFEAEGGAPVSAP